jgi:Leucine-rich repeat (LRR) protein
MQYVQGKRKGSDSDSDSESDLNEESKRNKSSWCYRSVDPTCPDIGTQPGVRDYKTGQCIQKVAYAVEEEDGRCYEDTWCPHQRDRDSCTLPDGSKSIVDAITMDCVPKENLFQASNDHCYEREYLIQWYNTSRNKLLPTTNTPFSTNDLERLGIEAQSESDDESYDDSDDEFDPSSFLDVSNQNITMLPDLASNLVELNAINNRLRTVPLELFNMELLNVVKIQFNFINRLPYGVYGTSITYIDLSNNEFNEFPEQLKQLVHLRHFYMSNNSITQLPEDLFENMEQLYSIEFNNNEIEEVPYIPSLYIELISFAGNRIKTLPKINVRELDLFNFKNNFISTIEEDVFSRVQRISTLKLSHNRLTTFPESFKNIQMIHKLKLNNNRLCEFPAFTQLNQIIDLNLNENYFREIPQTVLSLRIIGGLSMKKNSYDGFILNESIQNLTNLQSLQLSDNKLINADCIRLLPHLRSLEISECKLSNINWISSLVNLQELDVSKNSLNETPQFPPNLRSCNFNHTNNNGRIRIIS